MTSDIVAVVRSRPDVAAVVDGMAAFGESLEMRDAGEGVLHLHDSEGRLVVSVEAPTLVSVPGEAGRLLGPEMAGRAPLPAWWVEVRAASATPDARRIARRLADDIVRAQGGVSWPEPPAGPQAEPEHPGPVTGGGP